MLSMLVSFGVYFKYFMYDLKEFEEKFRLLCENLKFFWRIVLKGGGNDKDEIGL